MAIRRRSAGGFSGKAIARLSSARRWRFGLTSGASSRQALRRQRHGEPHRQCRTSPTTARNARYSSRNCRSRNPPAVALSLISACRRSAPSPGGSQAGAAASSATEGRPRRRRRGPRLLGTLQRRQRAWRREAFTHQPPAQAGIAASACRPAPRSSETGRMLDVSDRLSTSMAPIRRRISASRLAA